MRVGAAHFAVERKSCEEHISRSLVLQCYKTKSLAESASWDESSELMQMERCMLQPAQTLVKMTTSRSDLGFVTL
jgi:hypothetical protein